MPGASGRGFSAIVARTSTSHAPVESRAYDCAEVTVVRSGAVILFGEFGHRHLNVGDVIRRCQHCRYAITSYRARRRNEGRDHPRQARAVSTDGHIPRDWFRVQVWKPALQAAGLSFHVRPHDLRHAHASWLLAGGADLQVVKERLGHASIATTEKYLHTLPDADETAVSALAAVRHRGVVGDPPPGPAGIQSEHMNKARINIGETRSATNREQYRPPSTG